MSVNKIYSQDSLVSKSRTKSKTYLKRRNWFLLGMGLAAISTLSAAAGAILAVSLAAAPLRQSQLNSEEAAVFNQDDTVAYKNLRLPELSRPVNILVLGTKVLTSDVEEYPADNLGYHALVNSFRGLSDTMLLVRLDPQEGKLTVLSIPRDTQAEIEGHGVQKINAANQLGGPALAAETVSQLLDGVPIDRYVRVNVQGVEKLLDALGGVSVNVPKDMKYTDHSQHLYIDLKAGKQHLNGEQAVQFLRFRYDEFGDIGRVQRQQTFMRSLVEQALRPAALLKIPEIVSVIQSHIDTNLSVEEMVALSGFAAQTQRSEVQLLMLPGAFSGNGRHEISYWLPNRGQIQAVAAQYFGHGYGSVEMAEPSALSVAIQDSTDDPKAVQAMVEYLHQAGYNRVYLSGQFQEPLPTTRIVAQQGDDLGAATLRTTLGVGEVLVESTGNLASDVTIVLGQDWQQRSLRGRLHSTRQGNLTINH